MKKKVIIITIIIVAIITIIILYARFIGTSGLKINEYKITNPNITNEYHGLKVVHITDIHYSTTIKEKKLKYLVEQINFINPDIVVLTGDLLDETVEYNKDEIINNLKEIKAKLGKYAISGNHDYPIENYNSIIEESGFTNLDNTYELIYNNTNQPIIISGISSNLMDTTDLNTKTKKFNEYISTNGKPIYSILLIHEPDYIDNLDLNNYDLVLAGHSHNGQINIPLLKKLYLPVGSDKYIDGHYNIDNTDIFVSNGIGTSGVKFRLFSKPSFNFYRITNK